MMDFIVVIPARYASSRFPGKPLVDIAGKSMLLRTYEQCLKAVSKELVYVATESRLIVNHCNQHGMNVLLTSDTCLTGTDRIAEVAQIVKADYYINVQGDEPVFDPGDILKVIEEINKNKGDIINGYCEIDTEDQYRSTSIPKVVFRPDGRLLYMSRSTIPGNKNGVFVKGWRQVCIYGFPAEALRIFASAESKLPLEQEEDIEIIRFLELGFEVRMIELSKHSIAVDNPEDMSKVLKRLEEENV